MVVARAIVAMALTGAVCAQQSLSLLDCRDLPALLAERHGAACPPAGTLEELQQLLQRSLGPETNTVVLQGEARMLVVARGAEQFALVQRALEAVRAGAIEVRVQCTVFTRP